ncbi:MAG TPA: LytTR family DNA-binding domain-containing protein [Methylibium sp.]|uniref:LytTR family DNA-binding domain-containing protein n=1 Tax=Methylibium sp. TaxID=2067992 RepID=UPI002DBE3048|nr:LytTR family DNA-binding domain-containing protein [Methylibium sp.]HEU4458162.1 LytTR family DNA-binding domain-containing protein [Methylibium sp.]
MNEPALRVLIVDDEPLARQRLALLVRDVAETPGAPAALVVGEMSQAAAALAWMESHQADVLLLDIQMPGMDGAALASKLRSRAQAPAVVFVTAHAEHALQAFELEAADYLTKPVRRERLQAALERVARRRAADAAARASAAAKAPVVVVSERGRIVRVPLSEVLYLKAELKYVTLRTAERSYLLDDALSDIEQRLGERFLRVHRNAVVAKAAVRALERRPAGAGDGESDDGAETWAVRVAPVDEWLAVSRRQAAAVREALRAGGL